MATAAERTFSSSLADHGVEIIGGHKVKPHSKPYMVSIQVDKKNGHYEHKCGGALIGSRWVLTAAHCKDKRPIQVVLGAHNLSRNEKSQQKFLVKKQHPHPGFTGRTPENDIMLLEGYGGSPLICKGVYRGIVSYGCRYADPKKPGIYTFISKKYVNWIQKIIGVQAYNMTSEDYFEF